MTAERQRQSNLVLITKLASEIGFHWHVNLNALVFLPGSSSYSSTRSEVEGWASQPRAEPTEAVLTAIKAQRDAAMRRLRANATKGFQLLLASSLALGRIGLAHKVSNYPNALPTDHVIFERNPEDGRLTANPLQALDLKMRCSDGGKGG